ncbi:hypothetical protein GGC64_006628 [Mycobacterium sp. OAS707]|uniref:hypothetical protein n=1 Tax=Mycobacterium sp. OAS707 TaxID=2663822 RepID=UPI00178B0F0C|nr:hypothetical protein [Mycobacterium sp. OAS707]MBE1552541.1 hypothetical protein [Mycobacterium sp. OAS707]
MRVLRFIWRGVLAFDRVGSRIPQLIQIWLVELFFVMPLAFFIGKVIDIHGALGVPGTGGSIPAVFWGALVLALVTGFLFVRGLLRPRVVEGSWAPMVQVPTGTDVEVLVANRRARVDYEYLTSHPSYALLSLLTVPIPLSMWYFSRNEGDSTFYWRITGIVGLIVIAAMAFARVLAWYVFRFGRSRLERVTARTAWEVAWKPVLMLTVMCYAIVCIPLAVMFWQDDRRVAALPAITAADANGHGGQMFRVEGRLASTPVYWAPNGTGRGGNNYAGAGVLVDLTSGGQALLLAESMVVSDFIVAIREADGDLIKTQGAVIDEITDDQRRYYGFNETDFPPRPDDGRVLVRLTTP